MSVLSEAEKLENELKALYALRDACADVLDRTDISPGVRVVYLNMMIEYRERISDTILSLAEENVNDC